MNDSSDDEYAPIEATVWGSQTTTTTDDKETKGWDSLADPDIKVGPNDLGSGQLHRRGANFKPIGEDLILAQRLNKPVVKKAMQLALRKTEAELGLPIGKEKTKRNNTKKKSKPEENGHIFSRKTTKPTSMTPSHTYREVPSTTRVPVADNSTNGGNKWLHTSLVDTPFWEQKDEMKPISNNMTTTNTKSSPDIPNVEAGFTMIQLEPKLPMHTGKGKNTPPTKVEPVRPKVVNDWANSKNSWGAVSKEIEPFINSGWDSVGPSSPSHSTSTAHSTIEKQASNISGWGDDRSGNTTNDWSTGKHSIDSSASGWGVETTSNKSPSHVQEPRQQQQPGWGVEVLNTASMGWNEFTNDDIQPSSQPSWLNNSQSNATPDYPSQPTSPTGNRFSNPSKQRYSANIPMNAPKPINYRPQQKLPNTLPTAPPPPPENSILVTIYVEISETIKIPVNIHELDEPLKLARDFAENNKISAERIVSALTDLFTKQKNMALKVKQQKLRRRVPLQQQSRSRYYGGENNNLYTNSPSYSHPQHKPVQPFGSKDYY